jgi:large subunit ribosomal protein L24
MAQRIKRNDTVYVLSGKDRGRTGRVLRVMPGQDMALVEGVNMVRRHERQRMRGQPGGIVSKESPITLCRLMVVDPKTNEPGRVRIKVREDGSKVRVHAKTGNEID